MKMERPYNIPINELIAEFESDAGKGLNTTEATSRIEKYGNNTIQSEKGKHPLKILLSQFYNLMV